MTWTFTGLNSSTLYSRPDEPPSLTCIMYGVAQILVRPAHRFIVSLQVDTHQMFLTPGTCPSHIGRRCAVETSFSMDSFANNEALDLLAARLSYRHDDELSWCGTILLRQDVCYTFVTLTLTFACCLWPVD